MDIQALIHRQRVQYIVESYCLAGDDIESFALGLDELTTTYAPAHVQLALTEILVEGWADFPMARGLAYLYKVKARLHLWQAEGLVRYRLTAAQFEQITGLDPTVTFDAIEADMHEPNAIELSSTEAKLSHKTTASDFIASDSVASDSIPSDSKLF